jgi:hypothetical protein
MKPVSVMKIGPYRIYKYADGFEVRDCIGMAYGEPRYLNLLAATEYVRHLLMAEAAQRRELSV